MADVDMADADQVPTPGHDDTPVPPSGADGDPLGDQSKVVWILGDTVSHEVPAANTAELHLPADSHLVLDAAAFSDAPANLDHALHQLTTATDLFDVPVLDFNSDHS
jgi:hypothetical protein